MTARFGEPIKRNRRLIGKGKQRCAHKQAVDHNRSVYNVPATVLFYRLDQRRALDDRF
jgi:hypothetical protein